jgi:hypothetical protein
VSGKESGENQQLKKKNVADELEAIRLVRRNHH